MWSLIVSLGTRSRTDLAYPMDLFIYPFLFSFECLLSLGDST
jgi:hypothetical protein